MFVPVTISAAHDHGGRAAIEARLRSQHAISPSRAIRIEPKNAAESAGLEEAIGLGRVVRSADGKAYLNPAAAKASNESLVFGVVLMLLAIASVVASVIALIAFASR